MRVLIEINNMNQIKIVSKMILKNVQIFFLSISNCTRATAQKLEINIFQKDLKKLKKKSLI